MHYPLLKYLTISPETPVGGYKLHVAFNRTNGHSIYLLQFIWWWLVKQENTKPPMQEKVDPVKVVVQNFLVSCLFCLYNTYLVYDSHSTVIHYQPSIYLLHLKNAASKGILTSALYTHICTISKLLPSSLCCWGWVIFFSQRVCIDYFVGHWPTKINRYKKTKISYW